MVERGVWGQRAFFQPEFHQIGAEHLLVGPEIMLMDERYRALKALRMFPHALRLLCDRELARQTSSTCRMCTYSSAAASPAA